MSAGIRASVVITAHNEAGSIAACLQSLAQQTGFGRDELEVILVDDRSTDATADVARSALSSVHLLRIDGVDPGGLTTRQVALDRGIAAARGDVVLLMDADGHADAEWAATMIASIERGVADVVAAPIECRSAPSALLAALQSIDSECYLTWCRGMNALGCESGLLFGNAAFRRSVFGRIGGFGRMGSSVTEDLAFARHAHRAGCRIIFERAPRVSVSGAASWSALLVRLRRTSAGGISALSASLGVWLLLLAVPAVAAVMGSHVGLALVAGRYALGVALALAVIGHRRSAHLWLFAFIYEPIALVLGVTVAIDRVRKKPVEWGGVRYDA
jgi:cellulose synthase/poly-beta-1,6-N-acetylglucosamine synthase-like glycosyltransferase